MSFADTADKIRDKLGRGVLPRNRPEKICGSYGRRLPCDGCDEPILPAQVQYEFEVGERTIRLHLGCMGLWEAELLRRGWSRPHAAARSASMPSRTVLIVDDNEDGLDMLRTLLDLEGHVVVTAGCGEDALKLVNDMTPDIAFIDIGLPGMDGYEVARQLRRVRGNRPRLVALTGHGRAEDRLRALEAGFDVHVVKPVELEQLLRLLQMLDRDGGTTSES